MHAAGCANAGVRAPGRTDGARAEHGSEVASAPSRVALRRYQAGLRVIDADIGGERRTMLFDTGAGLTLLSPELARVVGCTPYGRVTAHRMTGERVDLPVCEDVVVKFGNTTVRVRTAGVLDLASFLPPDWPKVDGAVALATLEPNPVTVDLSHDQLVLETPSSLRARTAAMREVRAQFSRPAQGAALDVFVAAGEPGRTLWLEVDTGNTSGLLLAKHARVVLASDVERLDVSGFGSLSTEPTAPDLILDGNLGVEVLEHFVITLDLGGRRMWVAPNAK